MARRKRLKAPKGPVKVRDVISPVNPMVDVLRHKTGGGTHNGSKAERAKRACRNVKNRPENEGGFFCFFFYHQPLDGEGDAPYKHGTALLQGRGMSILWT